MCPVCTNVSPARQGWVIDLSIASAVGAVPCVPSDPKHVMG
jgi:hypothetical protein